MGVMICMCKEHRKGFMATKATKAARLGYNCCSHVVELRQVGGNNCGQDKALPGTNWRLIRRHNDCSSACPGLSDPQESLISLHCQWQ